MESYIGCYVDDESRDLPYGPKTGGYDHFSCNTACQGYRYFSLQASGQCFCGNAYSTQPQYVEKSDSECGGHRGLGGSWRNSIFRICDAKGIKTVLSYFIKFMFFNFVSTTHYSFIVTISFQSSVCCEQI